jgi:hypothetical protein
VPSRGMICPRFGSSDGPHQKEGAGNAGRLTHPQPCVQNEKRTQASHYRYAETIRHSLHDGLRLIARSPRCPGLIATVIERGVSDRRADIANSRDLIPASGDQDHTLSPSEGRITRQLTPPSSIASRTNVRDDRETPLL